MHTLSAAQTRFLRLRAGCLLSDPTRPVDDVPQLLREVCGLQAQEPSAAVLAVWARGPNLTAKTVEAAEGQARSIVRTWAMRGTLHLLATDDLGWLLSLFGPRFVRKRQHRFAQLGLDDGTYRQAVRAIREILREGDPMTRAELTRRLAERDIPTEGQAAYHLLGRAGLEGVICFGPDQGGESTFVLLEEWAPTGDLPGQEAALARLARRYLAAYGPAGPEDLASWSGLTLTECRTGFDMVRAELLEVEIFDAQAWMLKSKATWLDEPYRDGLGVHLLPRFDTYLLGYEGRALTVPESYARHVHPGGGMIRATLLLGGVAAGTWKTQRTRAGLEVVVAPWERLDAPARRALEERVRDLGRFFELDATLRVKE